MTLAAAWWDTLMRVKRTTNSRSGGPLGDMWERTHIRKLTNEPGWFDSSEKEGWRGGLNVRARVRIPTANYRVNYSQSPSPKPGGHERERRERDTYQAAGNTQI